MSNEQVSPSTTAERWAPPAVHGRTFDPRGRIDARGEKLQRAQVDAVFAKAQADGLAAGQAQFDARIAQLQERIDRFDAIMSLLSRPLNELDSQIEKQLVTLALTVARHLVRRELRIDPTQVIGIIRNTVTLLPAAARDVRVHLHPEDASIVRERLAEPHAERAWTIVEDPIMARGGCRVTTDNSQIDARLETRLGSAISSVLGSERGDSRQAQAGESPPT
jgi:flagellar assembly protein FliH